MIRFASPGAVALAIGPMSIRWYGVLLACAAVLGLALAKRQALRQGEDLESFVTSCGLALGGGIVGARLYHVAFQWESFHRSPWRILAVWEGGVAILGGILGGVALLVGYTWWKRLPLGRYLDLIAPSLVLGQAIGRWGNFFNEEAFGRPTDLPWGLYVSPARRPAPWQHEEYFHPTFLYESLWNFGIFLVLVLVFRQRCRSLPGSLFLAYLALYALGRIPIEALRLDSEWFGPYRSAQVIAAACLLAAALLFLRLRHRHRVAGVTSQSPNIDEGGLRA